MDWSAPTLWWLATGTLVAAELATGTFYLLMLAVGCAAGALLAHSGLGSTPQLLAAALVGAGATTFWHLRRLSQPKAASAENNRDVNLDIGEAVQVMNWSSDGQARVQYRGASWAVRYAGSRTPQPGTHTIVALHGNELRVSPTPSPTPAPAAALPD